ncbi:MAG: hypothetical protein II440_01675, partial [Clostridia bacterium]|nr:hypothetical protein [Clostridia bacterium]
MRNSDRAKTNNLVFGQAFFKRLAGVWGCGLPGADVAEGNSTDRAGRRDQRPHNRRRRTPALLGVNFKNSPADCFWKRGILAE